MHKLWGWFYDADWKSNFGPGKGEATSTSNPPPPFVAVTVMLLVFIVNLCHFIRLY